MRTAQKMEDQKSKISCWQCSGNDTNFGNLILYLTTWLKSDLICISVEFSKQVAVLSILILSSLISLTYLTSLTRTSWNRQQHGEWASLLFLLIIQMHLKLFHYVWWLLQVWQRERLSSQGNSFYSQFYVNFKNHKQVFLKCPFLFVKVTDFSPLVHECGEMYRCGIKLSCISCLF